MLHALKSRWPITMSVAIVLILAIAIVGFRTIAGPRKPPNIFDTPVEGVLGFLADDAFNKMSLEERLRFLQDVVKRFTSMSQSDSAIAAAFLAGLSGPAAEQLTQNARVLGKDVMIQGANEFLALKSQQERDKFLDDWIVNWIRFAEQSTGRSTSRSDSDILQRLTQQARRDVERTGSEITQDIAFQLMDFWERDIASVANPAEQARLFQFLPALRDRILNREVPVR